MENPTKINRKSGRNICPNCNKRRTKIKEIEEKKSKLTKKIKFYIKISLKKEKEDISYYYKRLKIRIKMEKY